MSELKGFTSVHNATLSTDIEDSVVEYFNWSLLNKGNYFNVYLNDLSPDGDDLSRLRMQKIKGVDNGKVWAGFRKNWVWQSGVTYSDGPPPLVGTNNTVPGVSGVYVDDVFYPNDTVGDFSHYVDHDSGLIIFDTAIPTGSKVQAEHSYKWINVCYAHTIPWLKELMQNNMQPDDDFLDQDSVRWGKTRDSTVELPTIAIEIVPVRKFKPYGLGGGQWVYTDMLFHCIGEDNSTREKLIDIVSLQSDSSISLFDNNKIVNSGDSPIDNYGAVVSGAMRYPDLVNNHFGGRIKLTDTRTQEMVEINSNIYAGSVRITTEGVKTNI